MSNKDNEVKILTELGLTKLNAYIYISITQLEKSTVKEIAQNLKIARAEVYRGTTQLQETGLIKKIIATPIAFKAVPLQEGLTILLQQNAEKYEESYRKTQNFLTNFAPKPQIPCQDVQYSLTSGGKNTARELSKDLLELKVRSDAIIPWRTVLRLINIHFEAYKEALKKGVKIRYISDIPKNEKIPPRLQALMKTGSFLFRRSSIISNGGFDILDRRHVHVITKKLGNIEVFMSNNPTILEVAQKYFELKWRSATEPCWKIETKKSRE